MLNNPQSKYQPYSPGFELNDRQWPSKRITRAPRWLSSDLRDGNQSLANPMDVEKKVRFYNTLVDIGFKEIEVGFASASQTDFDFVRRLIDNDMIPPDVTIQVLTQSRPDLISRTFEALEGAHSAIVHLYNAIAPLFRRVVFGMEKQQIIDLAIAGVTQMKEEAAKRPETRWTFEYSPETFSMAEPEFALEICERVLDVLQPTPDNKVILNLPATVEVALPNVYADQIEWFCRHISRRDSVVISVHPHNDRGTGVAAAEMALLAGADRVEGCLFGNGERTGNVDLVTLAMNLYTHGVDPELRFEDMRAVVKTAEYCNELPVHPRHPYAGELVFTAFSGSHQDAIKKGFDAHAKRNDGVWEMPYLALDPADIGESYEAVIRVNSQSGKGGVAWVLEQDHGLKLPRRLQVDMSRRVQARADETAREMTSADIWDIFQDAYHLKGPQRYELVEYEGGGVRRGGGERAFTGRIRVDGEEIPIAGRGNGLISSAVDAINARFGVGIEVVNYDEHALRRGADSQAAAYVECRTADDRSVFGVGVDPDVATASLKALVSALNGAQ
ncbi:2-isopropylmalate synthase [Camelimonas lactis]|uniref:2-isopropylmalate synthase n=1 Tax=Camelimonas lactis TaxID=659006 RepID=A0A4R2GP30_9HYPH|nr:2-isopropylmalate synthase [Camelimonas lactis]TCO09498.1 2-isopropylmalate synthase [Camelimonas lactis]